MKRSFFESLSNLVTFFARAPNSGCAKAERFHDLLWDGDRLVGKINPSGVIVELTIEDSSPEFGRLFAWTAYVGPSEEELRETGLKANGWSMVKKESIARAEMAAGLLLEVYRLENSNGSEAFGLPGE